MEFEQRCWDIVQALGSYPTAETLEEAYYQAMTFEQGDVDTGSLKMRDCWRIYRDTLPIQALLFSQALKKSREGGLGANQSLVETTQQAEAPEKAQINSFPSNIETGPAIAEDIPLAVHQLRQILRENCGDLGVDGSQAGSFDPMTTPLTAEHFKKANLRVPDILQDPPGPSSKSSSSSESVSPSHIPRFSKSSKSSHPNLALTPPSHPIHYRSLTLRRNLRTTQPGLHLRPSFRDHL